MIILGILGSPRLNGKCSKLLQEVLNGAESQGAKTQRIDLIKCNIKHCMGCCRCMTTDPELEIGRCPLKDDMAHTPGTVYQGRRLCAGKPGV